MEIETTENPTCCLGKKDLGERDSQIGWDINLKS